MTGGGVGGAYWFAVQVVVCGSRKAASLGRFSFDFSAWLKNPTGQVGGWLEG
jgi:hypothetical protein